MVRSFKVTNTGDLVNPITPQKLIALSSSDMDTQNLSIVGATSTPTNVVETRALTGRLEKEWATNSLATLTGLQLASAAVGVIAVYGQGQKAVGYIRVDTLPANNKILRIGLIGHTRTYTFKTTLTGAANEIALGADKFVCARNIRRAVDAATGSGTSFGTGTTANEYADGWADSGFTTADLDGTTQNQLYLVDVLATNRLLPWDLFSDDGGLTLAAPTGGGLGQLIGRIEPTGTQNVVSMDFMCPGLVIGTLFAGTTPTTDKVRPGGRPCIVRIAAGTLPSTVQARFELSDDEGVNWYTKGGTINIVTGYDAAFGFGADTSDPIQLTETVRLVVSSNPNTVNVPLHIVLIGS